MLSNPSLSYEEIEIIDESITKVLNAATRKVEGPRRNILYSVEKVRRQGTLLFWKEKVRQLKRISINNEVLQKRKEIYEIECPDNINKD